MTPEQAAARIAELQAENAELRAEVEKLRRGSVHDQRGWYSPFDPAARVPSPPRAA